jgi:hypothetical protein
MVENEMTLAEVAGRFKIKERTMREFLNRIGFEAIRGRGTLLFTEADYLQIREARRQCRSRSSRRAQDIPANTGYAGTSPPASDRDLSMKLQALRTEGARKKSASAAKRKSSTSSSSAKSQVIPLKRQR